MAMSTLQVTWVLRNRAAGSAKGCRAEPAESAWLRSQVQRKGARAKCSGCLGTMCSARGAIPAPDPSCPCVCSGRCPVLPVADQGSTSGPQSHHHQPGDVSEAICSCVCVCVSVCAHTHAHTGELERKPQGSSLWPIIQTHHSAILT